MDLQTPVVPTSSTQEPGRQGHLRPSGSAITRADGVVALLLFVGAVLYLSSLPRDLGSADESYFLYEAKRIRDGEVMYRDIFQFVTPLSSYAMAFLFWAFGTTMATARVSTAILHGLTMVILYVIARRLGVRRGVSAVMPLAFLALCQPVWPYASWHWFSTSLLAVLLLTLVGVSWADRPRWSILPGLVTGLLISVQQHKGIIVAAGVCLLFLVDHVADRRYACPEPGRRLVMRLAFFCTGVALVVGPLIITLLLVAGAAPIYYDLISFPLENYPNTFGASWGSVGPLARSYAAYTRPLFLKYLPVPILFLLARAAQEAFAGANREQLRTLTILLVFSGCSALSISYYPDFIHIAFIAPAFLICIAELLEWSLGRMDRLRRLSAVTGGILVLGLFAGLGLQLSRNTSRAWQRSHVAFDTAFGRLHFPNHWEPVLYDAARVLLGKTPSGELFCYPTLAKPYLATGGKNPTPFQFFDAKVFPAKDTEAVVSTLRSRRVPYIIAAYGFLRADDPIAKLISAEYEVVQIPELAARGEFPAFLLYGRKGLSSPLPGPTRE